MGVILCVAAADGRASVTGSGGAKVLGGVGAHLVQEVHAVALAAEAFGDDVGSVIELGGQNAKFVLFAEPAEGRRRRKNRR